MNINTIGLSTKDIAWLQGIHNTIAESQSLRKRLEESQHAIKVPANMVSAILDQTQPKSMWPNSDVTHAGNWPVDAEIGIEVETFHRDFGNRSGGKSIRYFNSQAEFDQWLSEEQAHICSIDYAYSAHIKVYEWDWGPEYKRTQYLG